MTDHDPFTEDVRRSFAERVSGEPSADWTAVADSARRAGRRRRLAQGGGLALAGLLVVGVVAFVQHDSSPGDVQLVTEGTPSPDPTQSTAGPSPSPSPSEPAEQPTSSPPPKVGPLPLPGPTGPGPIRVGIDAPSTATTGVAISIGVSLHAEHGRPSVSYYTAGDGTAVSSMPGCAGPTAPPDPYAPDPHDTAHTYQHTYDKPGTYTVVVEGDVFCSDYPSHGEGKVQIVVTGEPKSPSPSPSTSPSESPSPSPSAS